MGPVCLVGCRKLQQLVSDVHQAGRLDGAGAVCVQNVQTEIILYGSFPFMVSSVQIFHELEALRVGPKSHRPPLPRVNRNLPAYSWVVPRVKVVSPKVKQLFLRVFSVLIALQGIQSVSGLFFRHALNARPKL